MSSLLQRRISRVAIKQLPRVGPLSKASFSMRPKDPNFHDLLKNTSVDPNEVRLFSKIKDWWDPSGSQRALHAYNRARVEYIKRIYHNHAGSQIKNKYAMFFGQNMIDVGCGPGIFCEVSLTR